MIILQIFLLVIVSQHAIRELMDYNYGRVAIEINIITIIIATILSLVDAVAFHDYKSNCYRYYSQSMHTVIYFRISSDSDKFSNQRYLFFYIASPRSPQESRNALDERLYFSVLYVV